MMDPAMEWLNQCVLAGVTVYGVLPLPRFLEIYSRSASHIPYSEDEMNRILNLLQEQNAENAVHTMMTLGGVPCLCRLGFSAGPASEAAHILNLPGPWYLLTEPEVRDLAAHGYLSQDPEVIRFTSYMRERQLRPAEEVEETVSRMWLDCLEMDDSFDLMEDIAPRYHLRPMENPGQLMDFLDRLKAFADAVPRVSLHGFRPSLLHPEIPIPVVGRNDPCPCGSGLKYKKCHGKPGI